MQQSQNLVDHVFQEGRWSQEEHIRFLKGIMVHGKDWKTIQDVVESRQGSQVRSHAQKFFIKLNKISKERKKGKTKEIFLPDDIQKQILDNFTIQDLTQNTPKQIVYVLKRDWIVPESLNIPKKHIRNKKHCTELKKIGLPQNQCQITQKKQVQYDIGENQENNWNQQSFFIQMLKLSKQHIRSANELKNFIDFGQKDYMSQQQSLTGTKDFFNQGFMPFVSVQPENKERKKSFCLPNQQIDQEKLQSRLQSLHKAMGL